jgi:hypothetical protein
MENSAIIVIDKLPEGYTFYEYLSTLELCYKGRTILEWPKSYDPDPEYVAYILEEIKDFIKYGELEFFRRTQLKLGNIV